MGIPFRLKWGSRVVTAPGPIKVWEPTRELKFFSKIFPNLNSIVWKDQASFRGSQKDFRFNVGLVGFGSYKDMVIETARKIHNNYSTEQRKVMCREMEKILMERRMAAERHGDDDLGHGHVIQVWEQAVKIVKTGGN